MDSNNCTENALYSKICTAEWSRICQNRVLPAEKPPVWVEKANRKDDNEVKIAVDDLEDDEEAK